MGDFKVRIVRKTLVASLLSLFLMFIAAPVRTNAARTNSSCLLSSGPWVNTRLSQIENGSFRLTFDATASNTTTLNAVTGLSAGPTGSYNDFAVAVRFHLGAIDARNGTVYQSASVIPYSTSLAYHFILDVNVATHTYNAYVMIGSVQTTIGTNLAFHSTQSTVTSLGYLGAVTTSGSHTVCNIAVSSAAVSPAITTQPTSRAVTAGQTASFSVATTGTAPITYQWSKNGAAISGASSSTYTTPVTKIADNGEKFTVSVSNAAGTVTSSSASLTVSAPAVLLLNSSSAILNFGSVNIASTGTQSVTLTNAGNSNVTIAQVMIAGAGFNTTGATGVILAPGQSTTLASTFTPSATGAASGTITVSSNATNSPSVISLSATGTANVKHSVLLSWVAAAPGVTGFNAYISTVSGGPYARMTAQPLTDATLTDTTVQSGHTYYYVVTALNSSNQESAYSSEVSAIVP
jgi:hypothetical protein